MSDSETLMFATGQKARGVIAKKHQKPDN